MLIYSPELKKVLAFFCIPLCVSTRDIFSSPFGIVYLDAHTYRFVFKFLKSFFHRLAGDKDANYTEVLFLLQANLNIFFDPLCREQTLSLKKVPLGTCFNQWLRREDLNLRPSGYEPDELPDCSTPRSVFVRSFSRSD